MKRLTYEKMPSQFNRGKYPTKYTSRHTFQEVVARLAAYEDAMPLERAQELSQAEKDGRLVVLPCKVGDKVYRVITTASAAPVVTEIEIKTLGQAVDLIGTIGKKQVLVSWYLTREEAEAALKKREEEGDNEAD